MPEIKNIKYFGKNPECVIGWGYKKKSNFARNLAKKRNIPFYCIEEGFISSIGLNGESCPISSLIVDKKGIYYNPQTPSDLEYILQKTDISEELQTRAKHAIDFIKENQITKYNCSIPLEHAKFNLPIGENILLIDQTYGDASVQLASKGQEDFDNMYKYAKEHFPNANIIIKTHPDVLSGKKKGYLKKYFKKVGVYPVSEHINIHSLARNVDAIFTVTSLSGMEALISGAKVYCFGKPFYAGWGLTIDRKLFKRRTKKLSLEELFAASYILYPRYLNPYTQEACELEDILEIFRNINHRNKALHKPLYCVGFSLWKRKNMRKLLTSAQNSLTFCDSQSFAATLARRENGEVVVWASKEQIKLKELCRKKQVKLNRVEDGFIRSIDIGSNLIPALSTVIDGSGIYYDSSEASDLENIINNLELSTTQEERAENLKKLIIDNKITKYNNSSEKLNLNLPDNKRIILVVGQVADDASITSVKSRIDTNRKLLEETRLQEDDSFIIFKPHPDVTSGNREGHIPKKTASRYADIILENTNISTLIKNCDAIYTISSLVGFEALLQGKEVHCFGHPFYAGWGLTKDENNFERRKNTSLNNLIYASFIEYPRYIDPISGILCEPEFLINRIKNQNSYIEKLEKKSKKGTILRFIKNSLQKIKRKF